MKRVLEREQLVPLPKHEVFPFFEDPSNLELLTPPTLRFTILTPRPITMAKGAVIDYRLRLFGVPFRWRTLIEAYEPGVSFVDRQLRGPYRLWRHLHTFEETARGTWVRDRVEYELPFGFLGEITRRLFVGRQLEAIFAFRRTAVEDVFRKVSRARGDNVIPLR